MAMKVVRSAVLGRARGALEALALLR